MTGTLLPPGLAYLQPIVQDNTLAREFRDALFPQLLYRQESMVERWPANLGETQIMTRASLLAPSMNPLTPGVDPTPKVPSFEQWSVVAAQYGDTIDTNMPASRTALASLFLRNAKSLGLQCGQTLNRQVRDRLFSAYTSGDTVAQAAGVASTSLAVDSINGFTQILVSGAIVSVSVANPKTATISGVAGTVSITAAVPNDPNDPLGPGVLTLAAAASWAANARVLASDAPLIVRVGGAPTVDGLNSTSILTLADIRNAVSQMRRNRVPAHEDGYYHVHLDPVAVSQLFSDNEFQRLNQSIPDGERYGRFYVGSLLGCHFIDNSESPNVNTSGTLVATGRGDVEVAPGYHASVRNASGVGILRTVVTGGGTIYEKWIDETAEYASEAGYTGKVQPGFQLTNGGISINVERVRYILRAPLDRLQQIVSQSWSWSGDWGIPSDQLGGQTSGRFKRAVVIESGSDD
jgi:hypothetical protein